MMLTSHIDKFWWGGVKTVKVLREVKHISFFLEKSFNRPLSGSGGEGMSKYFSVLKTYPFKIKYPKPQSLKFYKSLSLTREYPLVFIQVTFFSLV